jgi:hypothetical protein
VLIVHSTLGGKLDPRLDQNASSDSAFDVNTVTWSP